VQVVGLAVVAGGAVVALVAGLVAGLAVAPGVALVADLVADLVAVVDLGLGQVGLERVDLEVDLGLERAVHT